MITRHKFFLNILLIQSIHNLLSVAIKLEHTGIRLISQSQYCNVVLYNMTNKAGARTFGGIFKMNQDPAPHNIQLEIKAYFDRKKLIPVPIKFTQNVCDAFEKNLFNIRSIFDSSNLTNCPLKKGTYKIDNWIPDNIDYPAIPPGRYQADLKFIVDSIEWSVIRWIGGIARS